MMPSEPIDTAAAAAEPAADVRNQAAAPGGDSVRHLVTKAGDLSRRSVERWRGRAEAWRDGASDHIRTHPMRSVAVAAGTGVLLALLLRALNR